MDNMNLKAAILAVILLIFTYSFYVRQPGSALSVWVPIILGVIAIVMLLVYFFAIKLIAHLIITKVYPSIALNILLPFLLILTLAWLVYAFIYVKPFGVNADFWTLLRAFLIKHGVFISICSVVIGLTFSFPTPKLIATNTALLQGNLIFSCSVLAIFIALITIFFFAKKIDQPDLNPTFKSYQPLQETQGTNNYSISVLATANPYNHMLQPIFLPNRNEVILVASYSSNNRLEPLETIYRIDVDGKIIEKLSLSDIKAEQYLQLSLIDGLITDEMGKRPFTWVFDGNKTDIKPENFVKPVSWQIDTLHEDQMNLKFVHFQKTSKFLCDDNISVKYNGNNYYDLSLKNDNLKFKIDSIYSHRDNVSNCVPKKLAFYSHPKLNFSLLFFDEFQYYVVKAKK